MLQDIFEGNILVTAHPSFKRPRVLLADYEYARQFEANEVPSVDLWWAPPLRVPPEGRNKIDPFAFDMYAMGMLFQKRSIEVRRKLVPLLGN